jgi:hypothetical protein
MDRFPESKGKDAQDQPVYAYCDETEDPIYMGESYLECDNGDILKDHLETVLSHQNIVRKYAGEDIV